VIACGKHVEPVAEQFVGELRRDPKAARGIFCVGDGEIDLFLSDDLFQILRNDGAARGSEDIADEKEIGQDV